MYRLVVIDDEYIVVQGIKALISRRFLLFAEIKTILQRIAVIVPGHPGSCIC